MHSTRPIVHALRAARGAFVTVLAATLLTAGTATVATAQSTDRAPRADDRGPGRRGPGGRDERLFQGITLSAAQRARVDSIRAAYRERMMADRDRAGAGARAGRAGGSTGGAERGRPDSTAWAARRRLMDEQRAAIRAVLTRDQQRVFDQNAQQMQQEMERRRGGGFGGRPGSGR